MAPKLKNGSIVHVEIVSEDPQATRKFFDKVFGWTSTVDRSIGYTMFKAKAAPPVGMRKPGGPGENPGTISYIKVANVDKTLVLVEKAGGKILLPKTAIPDMGTMAIFIAPGGVMQGIWSTKL